MLIIDDTYTHRAKLGQKKEPCASIRRVLQPTKTDANIRYDPPVICVPLVNAEIIDEETSLHGNSSMPVNVIS